MELGNQIKAHRAALAFAGGAGGKGLRHAPDRFQLGNRRELPRYSQSSSAQRPLRCFARPTHQRRFGNHETGSQCRRCQSHEPRRHHLHCSARRHDHSARASNQVVRPVRPHSGAFALGQRDVLCPPPRAHQKANNVQSYREILAFSEGKRLDEIEQKVEAGKRPYQKVLLALLTAGITLLVGMVLSWLLL